MPLISVQTNTHCEGSDRGALLSRLSTAIATALGKPERYVMVNLQYNPDMLFGGESAPLAYVELKSLGLPETQTADLSATVCDVIRDTLGVPPDRVYIEFAGPERHMWGWDRGTF